MSHHSNAHVFSHGMHVLLFLSDGSHPQGVYKDTLSDVAFGGVPFYADVPNQDVYKQDAPGKVRSAHSCTTLEFFSHYLCHMSSTTR